jgi:hypothetical protein
MMTVNNIVFVYMPSPTLFRAPEFGASGNLFAHGREDRYIAAVQKAIDERNLNWRITRDTTESNAEKLKVLNVQLLVCAPGLRFMFYRKDFDKHRMVYLTTMEYLSDNVMPVIRKLRELDSQA